MTQTYYKLPDFVGNDGYLSLQFPVAPSSCICMLYSLNAWSEEKIEHTAQQRSYPSFSWRILVIPSFLVTDVTVLVTHLSQPGFDHGHPPRTLRDGCHDSWPGRGFAFFFQTGLSCSKGLRPHDMSILWCSARYTFCWYCFLYITLSYCICICFI